MKHPYITRLAAYGFRTGMLLAAAGAVAALVFGSPATIETSLRQSGVYDAGARELAKQASDAISSQLRQTTGQSVIDKTASATITPQALQEASEKNIDNTYAWLEGKTAKPDIKVDLTPYVGQFTNSLGDQALQAAKNLPACTPQQAQQLAVLAQQGSLNIFSLPCLPPGINVTGAKDMAVNQAVQSNDFLRNPVLTADSLPKNAEGKTVVDQLSYLPASYQWSMKAPWLFGGLALLCLVLALAICWPDWRQGVRVLARSLLGVGIVLAVLTGLTRITVMYLTRPGGVAGRLGSGEMRNAMLTFITSLEKAYDIRLILFGVGYIVLAVIAFLALRVMRPTAQVQTPTPAAVRRPPTAGLR